jgi:thioredoxin-related protein
MSDEDLLSISSRICHFLMHHYISLHGRFYIPGGHMAQFLALCDYIDQGRAQHAKTNKKFKQICACE